MRKLLIILALTFAFQTVSKAEITSVDDPIILTEKIDNPISGNGGPSKSPALLYMYQSGNVLSFNQSYEGCVVSLLLNNFTVYTTVVDDNGEVTIPETYSGTFELQISVGEVIYWAEIQL